MRITVEEQFYLVWPWLIIIALRRRLTPRTMAVLLVGGIAASVLARALLWARADGDWFSVGFRTDANADALLIGALLAVIWRQGWLRAPRWSPVAAIGFLGLIIITLPRDFLMYGGFTLVAIAAAVLISAVLDGSPVRSVTISWLLQRPLVTHIGRISYGLYLWHVPMYNLAAYHLGLPGEAKPVVGVLLAFGAAELSMKLVERPFLRLKLRMGETHTGQEATRALAAA